MADFNTSKINSLLDEAGLCQALGVCRATVYLWRKKKRIPFFKVGGQYRYSLEEVLIATRVDSNGIKKAKTLISPEIYLIDYPIKNSEKQVLTRLANTLSISSCLGNKHYNRIKLKDLSGLSIREYSWTRRVGDECINLLKKICNESGITLNP